MFLLTADSGCMGDLIAVFVIFIGLPVVAIGVAWWNSDYQMAPQQPPRPGCGVCGGTGRRLDCGECYRCR
jgi:hypothetical protein